MKIGPPINESDTRRIVETPLTGAMSLCAPAPECGAVKVVFFAAIRLIEGGRGLSLSDQPGDYD